MRTFHQTCEEITGDDDDGSLDQLIHNTGYNMEDTNPLINEHIDIPLRRSARQRIPNQRYYNSDFDTS